MLDLDATRKPLEPKTRCWRQQYRDREDPTTTQAVRNTKHVLNQEKPEAATSGTPRNFCNVQCLPQILLESISNVEPYMLRIRCIFGGTTRCAHARYLLSRSLSLRVQECSLENQFRGSSRNIVWKCLCCPSQRNCCGQIMFVVCSGLFRVAAALRNWVSKHILWDWT